MDFKQIEYFVRVAELGSFTRAAQALAVAQPALSRQVRALEVQLRQHLLVRNGRGVTLTEPGRVLLEHGRGILHQVARAEEAMAEARGALTGSVGIGLPPGLARLLTVPLSRAVREQMPGASLAIREGLSTQLQTWLANGALDVALLYNPAPSAELIAEHVVDEPLYAVAPRGPSDAGGKAPITLAALADAPLVVPSRPNALRMLLERRLADIGRTPRITLELDGVRAILDLVSDGAGHAVLPRHSVAAAGAAGQFRLRRITQPALVAEVHLVTSARRAATLAQRQAAALLRQLALFHAPGAGPDAAV